MAKIYNFLFLILLFLYNLFPSWMLPLQNESLRLAIPRLLILIIFAIFCISTNVIKQLRILIKYKFVRYIIYFIFWELIALFLIYCFKGVFNLSCLLNILMRTTGSLVMIFIGFFVGKQNELNFIIKFVFWIIFAIYLYGLIDFLVYFFNISSLEDILRFFMNARTNAKIILLGKFPRIQAGFEEAAYYSYFVLLSLPLAYYFSSLKLKLFNNSILSRITKKSLILLAWVTLILSQSPIFFVFAIILTLIYKLIRLKVKLIKKIFIATFACIFFLCAFMLFLNINFHDSFLARIQNVVLNLNFKTLVIVEPSLATRLCSYCNMFIIFLHNLLLGCGTGNLANELMLQFYHSPIPLTLEIYTKINNDIKLLNSSVLFSTLAEQGIIGVYLFYTAFISLIKKAKIYSNYYVLYQKEFILHISYTLSAFLIFSFYESFPYFQFIWLVAPLLLGIFYQTLIIKRRKNENINC